eukprot:SAG31_NODE_6067_length_2185_cov_2.069990_1_plen_93_part_10
MMIFYLPRAVVLEYGRNIDSRGAAQIDKIARAPRARAYIPDTPPLAGAHHQHHAAISFVIRAAKELGSLCGRGVVEVTRYRDLFFKINRSGEH